MRPDMLSMCFAALMALFSEQSREFCPSADDECFRQLFDSFWLLNPAVASCLLPGDARSGGEHNLKRRVGWEEMWHRLRPGQENLAGWFRGEITYRRGSGHTYWSGSGGAAAAQHFTVSAAWWQVFVLAYTNLWQSGKDRTAWFTPQIISLHLLLTDLGSVLWKKISEFQSSVRICKS